MPLQAALVKALIEPPQEQGTPAMLEVLIFVQAAANGTCVPPTFRDGLATDRVTDAVFFGDWAAPQRR